MYPYDFKPNISGINHREIFVVMPFHKDFDLIYNDLIFPATTLINQKRLISDDDLKFYSYRTKDDLRTTSGWVNIMDHLFTAQVVLGVLTSNNPNVFYELGIAHATAPITRQVLIASKGYDSKFDTKDLIYYEYDPDNLAASIEPLSLKIITALDTYKIENEKKIKQARMRIGPNEFEVIMKQGLNGHFAISSDNLQWRVLFETQYGEGAYERHSDGISNLCTLGLLGLNTASKPIGGGVNVEFSYYWTSLGNDVLRLMEIITEDELKKRRSRLPDFFEK